MMRGQKGFANPHWKGLTLRKVWASQNPLRRWRTNNNYTQKEIAARLGVLSSVIGMWEGTAGYRGGGPAKAGGKEREDARRPATKSMAKIADLLGVGLLDLMIEWDRWFACRPGRPIKTTLDYTGAEVDAIQDRVIAHCADLVLAMDLGPEHCEVQEKIAAQIRALSDNSLVKICPQRNARSKKGATE